MKKVTDAILDLQNRSTYLDALKSDYMLGIQNLMIAIFDSEDEMTSESKEMMSSIVKELINSKEDLILNLNEVIEYIESLDYELWEMIK
ncbi:hypothetical protein [Methanobrevibacter sp.]|uniref:hypothetical protein n=1 Tax=Methanobrevibacter sp. TaxID=66852 RepID=UPI00386BF86D